MSKKLIGLAAACIALMQACNPECPPTHPADNDLAGYLDARTGILFTTGTDKTEVLAQLGASTFQGPLFKLPVYKVDESTVYLVFQIEEVVNPAAYINYVPTDPCCAGIFDELEAELLELIELDETNLADQFILACGETAGRLAEKENAKEKINKGKEKESLENLKKKKEAAKKLKKKISEEAAKKGNEAKDELNNGNKDGAIQKAKELKEKYKFYFDDYFGKPYCDDWGYKFKWGYGKYYSEPPITLLSPDLIKEFTHDNIRYKVYKNAKCGPGPSILSLDCYRKHSWDSLTPDPEIWASTEYFFRNVCERGNGFCVEQEVVIGLFKEFSDDSCKRMINVTPVKDFACFDK